MRSRFIAPLGLALLLAILPLAVQAQSAEPLDRIVAVVNEDAIMQSELETRVDQVRSQMSSRGMQGPDEQALRRQVLDRMILEEIQLQMAANADLSVNDTELNSAVRSIAESNDMTLEQFADALEGDGLTLADVRRQVRRDLLIRQVQQANVSRRVNVSDREIDRYLDQQGDRQGDRYHLAHILVSLPQSASSDEIQQAQNEVRRLADELEQGADFAELAAAESDGSQALEGGDLGWRSAGEIPSIFADTIPELAVGEVTEPLRSPSGFHLVKLLDREDGQQANGRNRRDQARQALFQRKANDELEAWLQEIRAEAFVDNRLDAAG
ncbi:peptidylprolyl isomerase [Aidingimonas lacisalsi]|uniref:peptidylprolyl isomerase n=1 Tax=Aidingimonas lacisalsi TaxID=2604086 RepID=UPI0011D2061B|nr:peptidylprolyl isomerase [Aidingimonas lacisalsi]